MFLPLIWIALPVYSKHIYSGSSVTLQILDMLLLDANVSTTWCQGQTLKMNKNFNAYLMDRYPPLLPKAQNLSITHRFELDDDLKEYWGFYLLKDSEMTITSCSKFMGASVKLIKGKKSLTYCTYIDIESSEEDDENRRKRLTPAAKGNVTMTSSGFTQEVDPEENGAFEENDVDTEDNTDAVFEDDESNSDDISSTSSSEEAMLKCEGIIISQPLISEGNCSSNDSEPRHNAIRYTVKEDGYYYVVFSSGDEKGPNPMMVKFDFLKTVYNVADAELVCANATECSFPFRFASNQKIVVSLAASDNFIDELEETFVMESVCQPRTPLYLAFGLTLPILVISFAFI